MKLHVLMNLWLDTQTVDADSSQQDAIVLSKKGISFSYTFRYTYVIHSHIYKSRVFLFKRSVFSSNCFDSDVFRSVDEG